jgi:hydroxymethylpyrimidine pyrophosphatase-like HAD family hydrolase
MIPFELDSPSRRRALAGVGIVATDVDGTLTTAGALTAVVVDAIAQLGAAGVEVIPVSGRSAGEVLGLVRYLPGVTRGIAENGQVLVEPDRPLRWLVAPPDRRDIEARAREVARIAGETLELAPDHPFRVGDVAFERAGRADSVIAGLATAAEARGLHVVWSSVHIHFSSTPPDKGAGLERALGADGPTLDHVLTMGDAPNDAGLFVADRFGASVGTHDVVDHAAYMASLPTFVCEAREGAAFLTVARALLSRRVDRGSPHAYATGTQ